MPQVIESYADGLMCRFEDTYGVFEATIDEIEVTDVTLRLCRAGTKVGNIYNDDGTARTMARLAVSGETDFISIEVPKSFVRRLLDTAQEQGRITNPDAVEGYRLRVLQSD